MAAADKIEARRRITRYTAGMEIRFVRAHAPNKIPTAIISNFLQNFIKGEIFL